MCEKAVNLFQFSRYLVSKAILAYDHKLNGDFGSLPSNTRPESYLKTNTFSPSVPKNEARCCKQPEASADLRNAAEYQGTVLTVILHKTITIKKSLSLNKRFIRNLFYSCSGSTFPKHYHNWVH